MKVTVGSGTDARKLELNGHERRGKRELWIPYEEFEQLLDRDDISLKSVTLNRRAGGAEEDMVDAYVTSGVANDYGGSIYRIEFKSQTHRAKDIKQTKTEVLEAKEDTLTVFDDFEKTIVNGIVTEDYYDRESFKEARKTVLENIRSSIGDHEQAIENLHEAQDRIASMEPEEVEN